MRKKIKKVDILWQKYVKTIFYFTMKAYAVVRKSVSPQKSVEHVFKVSPQKSFTIDSIEENRSIEVRRDKGDRPSHILSSKSVHFKIDNSSKDISRTSVSPSRKHRIFQERNSPSKTIVADSSLGEMSQVIREDKSMPLPRIESIIPKQLEREDRLKLKASSKKLETPERDCIEEREQESPFDKVGATPQSIQSEKPPTFRRIHKIFQTKPSISIKNSKISSSKLSSSSRKSQREEQSIKSSSCNELPAVPVNDRQQMSRIIEEPEHLQTNYPENQTELSESVIIIGCCGYGEDYRSVVKSKYKNEATTYSRKPEGNQTIIHKDFDISRNVSEQAIPVATVNRSSRSTHKQIFREFSPEMIARKSIEPQPIEKDAKIYSKPVRDTDSFEEPSVRKHKIIVFEIENLEPFEF